MTPLARRLIPLAVFLAGVAAAVAVMVMAGRARRAERARADAQIAAQLSAAFEAHVDGLARAIRGPAMAFELQSLAPREVAGVLRLSYSQTDGVSAVTLLDREGAAIVPAVFLPRPGGTPGAHPPESLDDLDRFSRQIPLEAAIARGLALRGPYANVHGDDARVALAQTIPVAQGTGTWVLAAELDAARLLAMGGLASMASEGEIALVTPALIVGALGRVGAEARNSVRAASRDARSLRSPRTLLGPDWRAVITPAPRGLDGVLVVAWAGEDARERRSRNADLALAVVVASVIGAVAAGLFVLLPDVRRDGRGPGVAGSAPPGAEVRVLGAVVKELANPISAAAAAARVLAGGAMSERVVETLQRSTLRVERVFRRVVRLTRAGEESARTPVDLAAVLKREAEAMRSELEHAGYSIKLALPEGRAMVSADADDMALLVQVLLDAARSVAPARSELSAGVRRAEAAGANRVELVVTDQGTLRASARLALTRLEEGTRTEAAAPTLPWALAARIAADHAATLAAHDVEGGVEVAVSFESA